MSETKLKRIETKRTSSAGIAMGGVETPPRVDFLSVFRDGFFRKKILFFSRFYSHLPYPPSDIFTPSIPLYTHCFFHQNIDERYSTVTRRGGYGRCEQSTRGV